ncbi:hypothetical protein [Algoriphagus sp. Y33]|uniref:hypothetical protein n=1 Tax=Algoriphagus sp. Y33 TaxID=2772483 RepID=UPI001783231B|nr:hypothetical protein [Algoriphagus sp. Y33]
MLKINFFTPFLLIFIVTANAFAQSQSYLSLYKEQLPYFQEIITGGQYKEPPFNYEGDPYYMDRKFGEGMLSINKITYTEVPLLYDEHADVVITFHPIYRQKILIKPEKIEEFQLVDGSLFRKFLGNDSYALNKNGFYKVIQDGELKVLMKYYKYTELTGELGKYTHRFVENTDYFYWHSGDFVLIRKKKQAFKSLGLKKRDVKKHMKGKSLYFSTDKEKYIIELVSLKESMVEEFNGFVE